MSLQVLYASGIVCVSTRPSAQLLTALQTTASARYHARITSLCTVSLVTSLVGLSLVQAPEDHKLNYGYAFLKGLFAKWLEGREAQQPATQEAEEEPPDDSQAAAQSARYSSVSLQCMMHSPCRRYCIMSDWVDLEVLWVMLTCLSLLHHAGRPQRGHQQSKMQPQITKGRSITANAGQGLL